MLVVLSLIDGGGRPLLLVSRFSERVNVGGTRTLLEACRTAREVRRLIQTSTSNVVVGGVDSVSLSMDESTPYVTAGTALSWYGWSKAEAEKLVLAANVDGFQTVAVRPCSGIFGPNDRLITQRALESNTVTMLAPDGYADYVYVDNVVLGHLLAEARLRDGTLGVVRSAPSRFATTVSTRARSSRLCSSPTRSHTGTCVRTLGDGFVLRAARRWVGGTRRARRFVSATMSRSASKSSGGGWATIGPRWSRPACRHCSRSCSPTRWRRCSG